MAEQQLEQIEGTVEDIIYENTDNGYMVFEVSGGGVVTVVCGIVGELHAGESVVCRAAREPRHLWPPVPRTGVRDRHAQGSGSGVRLPCQPVTAVTSGPRRRIRSSTCSVPRRLR